MEQCTAGAICAGGGHGLIMLAILFLGIAYLILQRIRAWYCLRHIRGPFWAAFSDFWIIRNTGGGRMYLELAEVCDEYGKFQNHADS
jgi:hypothetical protein